MYQEKVVTLQCKSDFCQKQEWMDYYRSSYRFNNGHIRMATIQRTHRC